MKGCVAEMGPKSQMNIYQDKKDKYKVGGRRHLQKWGRTENVYCGISAELFTSIANFINFNPPILLQYCPHQFIQ